jgi:RNA polymerase sigma-70 factor (ECF subfamily)
MRHVDPTDERKLVVRAKEGDMEAYECLVRSYERPIYYLCLRMAGAPQTADDLTQETFIHAYGALSGFKEDRDFYVWLRRIAVNASLNNLRAAKREEPLGDREPDPSRDMPQDELQRREVEGKFQEALGALPSDQRTVFVLRVFEDQSYRDIAHALKISKGTVMSRLSRAREKLRAALADLNDGRRP